MATFIDPPLGRFPLLITVEQKSVGVSTFITVLQSPDTMVTPNGRHNPGPVVFGPLTVVDIDARYVPPLNLFT